MRILIVDDEISDRVRIRVLLESEPGTEVVGECGTGTEAVEAILALAPDLVFLGVQMPDMDGLQVARTVGAARLPLVVFVSRHHRHAVGAFDVRASDYLLKPFTDERFRATLDRARAAVKQQDLERLSERLEPLLNRLRNGNGYVRRLVVRQNGRVRFFDTDDIDWIEAHAKFVRLHTDGSVFPLRESIGHLEEKLDPSRFLRIHRSAIVNVERVAEIETSDEGSQTVVLKNGARLPLSRGHRLKLYELAVEDPSPTSR
jgi:two-component system, LytTR family, response regulator